VAEQAVAPPGGWKPVHHQDATFYVPAAWPVERPTDYQFACATFSEPGAFLAPDAYTGGFRCPAALAPYADTVHVQPYDEVPVGDSFDINGFDAYHLQDGEGRYLHVALPELRVAVVIYGPDNDLAWKMLRTFQRRQPGNDESATGPPDP